MTSRERVLDAVWAQVAPPHLRYRSWAALVSQRLVAHGIDARAQVSTALGGGGTQESVPPGSAVPVWAGRLGAGLERWLRLGLLGTDEAAADEWALVDACLSVDYYWHICGEWRWTFVWTHTPTGAAVMVGGLPYGTGAGARPRDADETMVAVTDDTESGFASEGTVASCVEKSHGGWARAESLEGLVEGRLPEVLERTEAAHAMASPVIATPAVQGLAQLRGPAPTDGPVTFLDMVGSVPVREKAWIPCNPGPRVMATLLAQPLAVGRPAEAGGGR